MTTRLQTLSHQLAELVGDVRAEDIPEVLARLVAATVDVGGVDDLPEVPPVLRGLREGTAIPLSARLALDAARTACDLAAATHHRSGDITRQRTEFRRARAIDVVALAISSEPDQRITLREAVYEATAAIGTTAGVVGILSDFVA